MNEATRNHLDRINDISLKLEKAWAIMDAYRDRAFLDYRELADPELMILKDNHNDIGLLFYSAQDYIGEAMQEIEAILEEA